MTLKKLKQELRKSKQYVPGTLESILEDRLADMFVRGTVESVDEFVSLVLADIKQDRIVRELRRTT